MSNPAGSPHLKRALLAAGLLLLLAALVALLAGGVVRDAITRPFVYAAWFVSVLFADFPQAAIWAVFVTCGLIIALSSLRGGEQTRRTMPLRESHVPGRIARLANWLSGMGEGRYFQRQVARHVLDLTLRAKGYEEPLSPRQVEDLLAGDDLRLPADVRDYLASRTQIAYLGDLESMTRSRAAMLANLREFFFPLRSTYDSHPAGIEPGLARLVEHLESELEIPHEHRN